MKLHLPFRNISTLYYFYNIHQDSYFLLCFDPEWFFFFLCVHMTTHYINEREPMFCAHYSNSYYKSACFLPTPIFSKVFLLTRSTRRQLE